MYSNEESEWEVTKSEEARATDKRLRDEMNALTKCCDDDNNLKYIRAHDTWPYERWSCKKCKKEYNVELIRDFKNKETK